MDDPLMGAGLEWVPTLAPYYHCNHGKSYILMSNDYFISKIPCKKLKKHFQNILKQFLNFF
jgi:hypothetical protein